MVICYIMTLFMFLFRKDPLLKVLLDMCNAL